MANLTDTGTKAHDNTQAFPSVFNDLSESAFGSLKLLIVSFLTEILWFDWTCSDWLFNYEMVQCIQGYSPTLSVYCVVQTKLLC